MDMLKIIVEVSDENKGVIKKHKEIWNNKLLPQKQMAQAVMMIDT